MTLKYLKKEDSEMRFPDYLWIIIIPVLILLVARITYTIATRNRGSFADTPEWSKVIRRIIEIICVFVILMLMIHFAWSKSLVVKILVIAFPIIGIIMGMLMCKVANNKSKDNRGKTDFKGNLFDHLLNTIILILFQISALLIVFIVMAEAAFFFSEAIYFFIILDFLLSIEFSFLLYQLYYLIYFNNIPNNEIVNIVRICKELND